MSDDDDNGRLFHPWQRIQLGLREALPRSMPQTVSRALRPSQLAMPSSLPTQSVTALGQPGQPATHGTKFRRCAHFLCQVERIKLTCSTYD